MLLLEQSDNSWPWHRKYWNIRKWNYKSCNIALLSMKLMLCVHCVAAMHNGSTWWERNSEFILKTIYNNTYTVECWRNYHMKLLLQIIIRVLKFKFTYSSKSCISLWTTSSTKRCRACFVRPPSLSCTAITSRPFGWPSSKAEKS